MTKQRIRFTVVFALCFFFGIAWSAEELPTRLSDEAFWKLVTDFSEPGRTLRFRQFCFKRTRNAARALEADASRIADGAYLGVGPEQNFTYIVALKRRSLSSSTFAVRT